MFLTIGLMPRLGGFAADSLLHTVALDDYTVALLVVRSPYIHGYAKFRSVVQVLCIDRQTALPIPESNLLLCIRRFRS